MFIIVNKDFSIAQITPTTVYQGSNLANEVGIFAPFSVSSYTSIILSIMLPSGEYIDPLVAFPAETQPLGFGAWSVSLPASVSAIPGTVKMTLSFIGSDNKKMVTEAAEFIVTGSIPVLPPSTPTATIYEEILVALSSILERHPDWTETNQTNPSYIANKAPIIPQNNGVDAKITGDLQVDGVVTMGANAKPIATEEYAQELAATKLDAQTVNSGTYAYTVSPDGQSIIEITPREPYDAISGNGLAQYGGGKLMTNDPPSDAETNYAVNTRYLRQNAATAIKGNATGTMLLVDDTSFLSDRVVITNTTAASVQKLGRNILNAPAAFPDASSASVTYNAADGSITFGVGSKYAVLIPVKIYPGQTVSYSFSWNAESGASTDALGKVTLLDASENAIVTKTGIQRATITVPEDAAEVAYISIAKTSQTTALVGNVIISEPCINIGTYTRFSKFQNPETITLTNGEGSFRTLGSDVSLIAPNANAPFTVTYTRDTTKVIDALLERIEALETAATL